MPEGVLLIAGDRETGEEYLARVVDDAPHGHDPPPRPIVQVLRVVRYPDQRAIADPDVAMEFPAIGAGTMCRLESMRDPTAEECALSALSPEESVRMAIIRAMDEARNEAERDILRRHAAGQYGRARVLVTFHSSDISYLTKYSGRIKGEHHGLPEDLGELPRGDRTAQ